MTVHGHDLLWRWCLVTSHAFFPVINQMSNSKEEMVQWFSEINRASVVPWETEKYGFEQMKIKISMVYGDKSKCPQHCH